MIPDEPVRGRIPPLWTGSLSGLERIQMFSTHRLPVTPLARLVGLRFPHVAPGSVTMTMPASQILLTPNEQIVIAQLCIAALYGACETAAPVGVTTRAELCSVNALRPVRALPGNLLARARVTNVSRYLAFAEVEVEDSEGRSVAQAQLHASFQKIDPPPPDAPASIAKVEEPVYDTPDPYLRSLPTVSWLREMKERSGLELLRELQASGEVFAAQATFGIRFQECSENAVAMSMPASDWYCNLDSNVDRAALGAFGEMLVWLAATTGSRPGDRLVALNESFQFLRPVKTDGRLMVGRAEVNEVSEGRLIGRASVLDADGNLVMTTEGTVMRIDGGSATLRRKPERILATLLFSDIVASTEHAQRLGDAEWTALLEQHYAGVRREISRYNGTEVATAGDGFFVRFDSPAQAVQAARAVRAAAARQQMVVRIGLHTGECEIENNRLSGIAVHLAARIQATAEPGEILVSSTVRELTTGGRISFSDRGEFELKGIQEKRRLFALVG